MKFDAMPWCQRTLYTHAAKPVLDVLSFYRLLDSPVFPTAQQLNCLAKQYYDGWEGPAFKAQSSFSADDTRYYEARIKEDGQVPTREESWHDLFNGLIWLQFPKTKSLLNRLHMQDICRNGAHPRTPRRNRITHFDECGVIFAVEEANLDVGNRLLSALAKHEWKSVFVEQNTQWQKCVHPVIFGHANFEMLLTPFTGLTAKWLCVKVPNGFSSKERKTQLRLLDAALYARIRELDDFTPSAILKPVPLLGIPGWYPIQDSAFYDDKEYFRPLSAKAKNTIQLPLT